MDPQGIARALEIERQLNAGEGRTVEELIKSDDPLKGVEAARLRRWFSSNKMIPLRDLTDDFGSAVLFGRLEVVQADILARMHKHAQRSTPDPRAAVVRDIYEMRWGPTQVPIFNLILLSTLLVPAMRPQQLAVARFLINEMKMPVDGRDLSGATGLYHAISTKPAFDPEYAQILVDAGGDVNARNRYGDTTAAEIAMLRDYGADGKQRARDALAWFFAHGGNVDVMNTDGVSARWVMATAHQQMVQVTGVMRALAQLPMWDVVLQEDERRKALGMKACAFCARVKEEGSGKALLLCSRCKCVTYCAPPRKCQMDDWRHHKGRCKPNKASRGSTYLGVPLDS